MAVKHMRIGLEGTRILVEDLGSVNGIYLKILRSTAIEPGMRFRVGAQVIEFCAAEPTPATEPLVGPDGEAFWSRDLDAYAYLQLIRADGNPGLRFPLTHPVLTTIGRTAAGQDGRYRPAERRMGQRPARPDPPRRRAVLSGRPRQPQRDLHPAEGPLRDPPRRRAAGGPRDPAGDGPFTPAAVSLVGRVSFACLESLRSAAARRPRLPKPATTPSSKTALAFDCFHDDLVRQPPRLFGIDRAASQTRALATAHPTAFRRRSGPPIPSKRRRSGRRGGSRPSRSG